MDHSTYRHLFGQIKSSSYVPHHNFPCHNLISVESLAEITKVHEDENETFCFDQGNRDGGFLDSFPSYDQLDYDIEMCLVLFTGSGLYDVAENLVQKKLEWMKKLKLLQPRNITKAVTDLRKFKTSQSDSLSIKVKQYLNHFNSDPEPNFQGYYNWLYTGGNITSSYYDDDLIFFSGDHHHNNKTMLNVMKIDEDHKSIESTSMYELKKPIPLLQVVAQKRDENIIVLARQKNTVTLLKVNDILYVERVWRKKVKNEKLLTCADVNSFGDEVVIVDNRFDINKYCTETGKKLFGGSRKLPHAKDAWNQIMFGDKGLYCADRNSFYIVDAREKGCKINMTHTPSAVTETCEVICNIMKSDCHPNYVYLAMTHSLVQIDVRNSPKNVQKWTHMMTGSPQFGQAVQHKDNEFIILQSKQPDEIIGIASEYNEANEECKFLSKSTPCILKSVKDTLRLANYNGNGLSPNVRTRMNFTSTGSHLVNGKCDSILFFTSNSAGDIFLTSIKRKTIFQQLHNEEHFNNVIKSVNAYEEHVNKLKNKKMLYASDMVDMRHVLDRLKYKVKEKAYVLPDVNWKYSQMFVPESLKTYKDVLAQKLLHVWGIQTDDTDNLQKSLRSNEKVEGWLKLQHL